VKLNNVDFNKIAIFCQVIESGNYQRASEALHVTPSALSQTITNLEHSLGFALFDRRGRRLVPTKDGLKIHQEFGQSQAGFMQTLRQMKGRQSEVSGTLRIGAYLEFAKSKLTVLLKEFIQEFPDANIKMVFDSPSRLHKLLGHGQLDLCLSIFPATERRPFVRKSYAKKNWSSFPLTIRCPKIPRSSKFWRLPSSITISIISPSAVGFLFSLTSALRKFLFVFLHLRPKWLCPLFGKAPELALYRNIWSTRQEHRRNSKLSGRVQKK